MRITFFHILFVAMLIIAIYAIHNYQTQMATVWQATAAQKGAIDLEAAQHNAQVDVREHDKRAQLFTGILQGIGSVIVLLVFGVGAVYAWKVYDQRQEAWARPVDGQYALQQFNQAGQVWTVDPNKSIFGIFGVDKRSGAITTDASMVGPDRQLAYATTVQQTRTMATMSGEGGIRNSAQAKFAAGYYDRPQGQLNYRAQGAPAAEPAPAQLMDNWQPLSLVDAFAQAQPDRWLLGQNATGACEFNLSDNIHTGLLGATGTGKSSGTALLMALCAIKHGLHVIALDGKGGVDWAAYNRHLEAWPTDYTVVGDQVSQIVKLHDARMKDIKRAGVANIYELDYQVKPLFVILEEFGFTMQALRSASRRTHDAVENNLSNLMRVSRSTGIHFLLIDQSAQHWPGVIKANVKAWFAYRLGGQQGNAFNAYNLHELKPKGQFWYADNVYNAWFTKGEVDPLLKKLSARKYNMLTDGQYSVGDQVDGVSSEDGGEDKAQTATPIYSRPPIDANQASPVSHSPTIAAIDGAVDAPKPQLTGKPLSQKDKALVRNTYALTGQYKKTCELLWGKWNPSRDAWAKEVMAEGEVLQ